MIKTSRVSPTQAFYRAKEPKNAEQKALAATKNNEISIDYLGATANRGNHGE